ncbi:MAG: HAD family hydrolase [Actinomycetota bacterium]
MTTPVPIAAVILDFDGTIIDTESSQYETVREEFRRAGVDFPLADFLATIGRGDHRHWSDVLQDRTGPLPNIDEIRARRLAANHRQVAATPVRPGIADLLDRADRHGLPLGVASSSPSDWVDGHLETRGLRHRFATVATRDHVERAKPWPDVYLLAAERLAVEPGRCLVIEDSGTGIRAAKDAGMWCVAVPNPITAASDLSGADLVLSSLTELPYDRFGLG